MSAIPGTTIFGYLVREQICQLVRGHAPNLILRTAPGMKGVDIEVPSDSVSSIGFQFAEVKPKTNYGLASFNALTAHRDLPTPLQSISYDYVGNIYYGFAGVR